MSPNIHVIEVNVLNMRVWCMYMYVISTHSRMYYTKCTCVDFSLVIKSKRSLQLNGFHLVTMHHLYVCVLLKCRVKVVDHCI